MPKLSKKFIVFDMDSEIYMYHEDTDASLVNEEIAYLFDSLKEAKEYALEKLDWWYNNRKEKIQNLKYKDFK